MKKLITLINLLALCVTTLFAQAPEKFTYQAVVRNASNQLVTNAPVGVQVSVLQGGVAGTLVYMETHTSVTNDNGLLTLAIGGGNLQQGDFASIDWANGPYFLKTEIDPSGGTNYSITSVQQLLSVPYALYSKEAGNGFSGDYNDLTNLPQIPQNVSELTNDAGYITMDSVPTIPSNVSAFDNDAGYLTGYTETDPQFNAWDKDYNDLINTPEIPTVPNNVSAFVNDAGYITMDSVPTNVSAFTNDVGYLTSFTEQQILSISNDTIFLTGGSFVKLPAGFDGDYNSLSNKPELFSGDYNDLANQPAIPTIPTEVSVFNNDAGYITMDSVPTNVSAFTNDAGYITMGSVPTIPTNVSAFTNDAGYLTGYTETDPEFNAWDKDYNDLINKPTIPAVPTNVSAFTNDAGYITMDSVPTIPTNVSAFTNDAGYLTGYTETDPQFNAWDKDYNDLTNKPVNADFGHGIVRTNVNNPSGATDIAVTFTGYSLMNGGVVSLGFTRNVPAGATLNINNKGAKMIRWKGTALTDGIIKAGDRCLFMYNSGNESYYLLANDRWGVDIDALAAVARTGSYNDLSDKPEIPSVPTNVSAFTNDAGYLTGYTETDPEFNAWDKDYNDLINKPVIPTIPTDVSVFNNDAGYITMDSVPTIPTNVSAFTNDAGYLTGYTETDPEFNAWDKDYNDLTNKPNLATVATTGNYNDLTNTPNLAPVATTGSYNDLINTPTIPTVPTNVSAFVNDAGYLTAIPDGIGGISIESDPVFSAWNKDYNDLTNKPNLATVATTGDYNDLTNKPNLAPVATTGSYNDLTNTPTIPAAQVNADWNATSGISRILNKPNLAPVATTGSYNDLTNTPTIPAAQVNADWNATNGMAEILNKPNLATVATTGNYNDLTNTPAIPTVPTNVSAFTNDAGYITQTQLNSSNYVTNTGTSCENTIDLCNLLNTIENLQNQVQELANMAGGSPYGTASSDTCPRHIVMIDGNPNACYYGFNTLNITLAAWVDGYVDMDATYTWYESGQSLDGHNNYLMGSLEPTYNNPYIFTVEVTKSNGCSYVSAPFEVNVYDKPYATITGSDNEICAGESVSLRANLQNYNDPMITFQWYENQEDNSHALPGRTHETEDFTPASTTDYIVKVTHLMDYSYESCVAYDTFRVEVTECDTAGGGGTDTTQTSQHTISISLTTDNWGSETSWQVTDVSNNNTVLASGGPYSSNSTQDIPDVIVDGTGCYVFIIYDSYGDGIYSSGNYSVSYDSVVMGSGGGNSFSQESYILNPESSSCPSDEISLTSLNISTYQALNNNFQIKGKVTNNGANAITSFKVKYRVDGGAWSSDYSVSCNIVSLGTLDFTHDVPASIASTGQHTIDVMVYEPNGNADDETDNSISMNVEVSGIPDGDVQPCPGSHTISDIDGNVYNTVQIGSQCWLAENLRATRYADGTDIPLGTDTSSTTAYRYNPSNNANNVPTYGYLYNWRAVMHNSTSSNANPSGVQGICPTGWHVPSDAEWTQLTDYVKGHPAYYCEDSNKIAKALAGNVEWYSSSNDCAVGNGLSSNNTAGFNAMPAGYRYGSGYSSFRSYAYIWSATEASNGNIWNRNLYYTNATVNHSSSSKFYGYSVRCLRDDNSISAFPTVTTDTVSNVTDTSATCGGSVTAGSGTTVTDRGVCWSTSPNPNLADNHTSNGSGTGSFISNLTDVEPYHIIYVRAYATSTYGTVYGNEVSFSTVVNPNGDSLSCPETPIIMDIDGNYYNTVQIGGQCWMRENLRTMNYADGSSITLSNSNSNTTYGLLYNWSAVMHGASSSDATPSGVQGICPDGWHVPSDAEWTQLTDYVGSRSDYVCNGDNTYIAKALASTTGWTSSSNTCSVGKDAGSNNTTGFNARSAGGYSTSFWCSTDVSNDDAWYREIYYSKAEISHNSYRKTDSRSIRCLRDEAQSQSLYFPTVTTTIVSNIAPTSATCGGNIISNGGASITERGVCWSTRHYPTIYDAHKSVGNGSGSFNSSITQLASNITYYVRAYATNQYGTVYGNEVSFTTTVNPNGDEHSCSGTPIVTDVDGNVYNTVQIGGQCWLRENLRTTKYSDGTSLTYNSGNNTSYSTGYWHYPNGDSQNKQSYGLLYNWKAVMHDESSSNATPSGVQGICPNGWHLPSDAEWSQLVDYVSSQSEYGCGNDNTFIGKALAASTGWLNRAETCSVGNDQSSNNATRFGALPAGFLSDHFANLGYSVHFWSSTEQSSSVAYFRDLFDSYKTGLDKDAYYKYRGYSVRCLRNDSLSQYFPSVTTSSISNVTATTATCGGNITSNGGVIVTSRGVCWGNSHNPTIESSHVTNGTGSGSFSTIITRLAPNLTYYVRAYATTPYGTVYGNEVSFTTPVNFTGDEYSCPAMPTVTDVDGNIYHTVKIGNQCWLRENLRVKKYADGTVISESSYNSTTVGYWSYPNEDSSNQLSHGLLYNWAAVMRGATSCDSIPSGVQGICPIGWHVPSNAEWTQLINYVSSQSEFPCGSNNVNIAKALAATSGWKYSSNDCATGNNSSTNNTTGFGVISSGCYFQGIGQNYLDYDAHAAFWCSTEQNDNTAYIRYISYNKAAVGTTYKDKYRQYSVRCLRDPDDGGGTGSDTTQTNSHTISVSLITDRYGSDITWQVKDVSSNTVFASGGPYSNLSNAGTTVQSIPDITVDGNGCYVFTINDSYGDGICCSYGNGSYSVSYDGTVIGSGGNAFSYATYFLNPTSSTCPSNEIALTSLDMNSNQIQNAYFTVSGNVTNNGVNPVTSYKVKYRVDNGSWTADYTETCNIASGESSSFTHNVLTAIPTTGQHTLEVVVSEPNGMADNVSDNTLTMSLLVSELPSGDAQPCPNATTVTDIDGHVYNTVKLGSQCWMASNLRTTRYADGTLIAQGSGNSTTTAYRYTPDNNEDYLPTYGYLYNWSAVMHGANGSSANPSGVQGICPNGWHVPSNAEWNQLTNYLMNEGGYTCGSGGNSIAKALASTTGWNCSSVTCAIGNTPINNNSTGFGVYASGYYNGGTISMGVYSYLWSTTEYGDNVISRGFCSEYAFVPQITNTMKQMGHPVRCLRD